MTTTALLAEVEREGFIESTHSGVAVLLDPDRRIRASLGDVEAPFLARSALKPIFAGTLLSEGAIRLEDRHLALASASHTREPVHVTLAMEMAAAHGVEEDDLRCPVMHPVGDLAASRFAHMCSGKHITMAAAARAVGGGPEYIDPEHPLQALLRAGVERATGVAIQADVIDGCGARVFSTTPVGLAFAYQQLVVGGDELGQALQRTGAAMLGHPALIDGPHKPDATVIERTGCITKFGAEGTQALVAPDGHAVVVKIADGSRRAGALVALTMLEQADVIAEGTVETLSPLLDLVVTGGGHPVGRIRAAF